MSKSVPLLTPVGRMVQGHPFEFKDTDMKGRPLTNKDGSPRVQYFTAIAITKTDPGWAALWAQLNEAASYGFANNEQAAADFAWKYVDGDDPKQSGKPGFAGCHVLKFTNGFAPRVYDRNNAMILDEKAIKRGDFIRISGDAAGNGCAAGDGAGLYLNVSLIQLVGYGEEIATGPDAEEVFGSVPLPATLPAGASATPVASGTIAPPANNAAAVPATPDSPGAAPPPPPGATSPQYTMTPKAEGKTREMFHTAGWTDKQLIDNGYMLDAVVTAAPDALGGPR